MVLDHWGIAPLGALESRDMLQVIDGRAGTQSAISASQLSVEHWYATISELTVADGILDRLVPNSYQDPVEGDSMRKAKYNLTEADRRSS